jgi:hypothetical protein
MKSRDHEESLCGAVCRVHLGLLLNQYENSAEHQSTTFHECQTTQVRSRPRPRRVEVLSSLFASQLIIDIRASFLQLKYPSISFHFKLDTQFSRRYLFIVPFSTCF